MRIPAREYGLESTLKPIPTPLLSTFFAVFYTRKGDLRQKTEINKKGFLSRNPLDKRREGDSNPRYAFGVYTLSRRFGKRLERLYLRWLRAVALSFAVFLQFSYDFWGEAWHVEVALA